jgi:hypothetical protein
LSEDLFAALKRFTGRQKTALKDFNSIVRLSREQTIELRVKHITVASPGVVELIGSINPLKTIADFILAWRHENTIRDQNERQMRLERYKVRAEIVKTLLEKASTLRTEAENDHFAEKMSRFLADESLDTLVELAKDIRLVDISWLEITATKEPKKN